MNGHIPEVIDLTGPTSSDEDRPRSSTGSVPAAQQQQHQQQSGPRLRLEDLPLELQTKIVRKLPYRDVVRLGSVNKHFHGEHEREERRRRGSFAGLLAHRNFDWQRMSRKMHPHELHKLASLAAECNRCPSRSMQQDPNRNQFLEVRNNITPRHDVHIVRIKHPLQYRKHPEQPTTNAEVLSSLRRQQRARIQYIPSNGGNSTTHDAVVRSYDNTANHVCPHVPSGAVLVDPLGNRCNICSKQTQDMIRRGALAKHFQEYRNTLAEDLDSDNDFTRNRAMHRLRMPYEEPGSDDDLPDNFYNDTQFGGMIRKGKRNTLRMRVIKPAAPHNFFKPHDEQQLDFSPLQPTTRGGEEVETFSDLKRTTTGNIVSRRQRAAGNPESAVDKTLEQGLALLEKEVSNLPMTSKKYQRPFGNIGNMSRVRRRRCQARTPAGPCRAWAMHGCRLCRAHRRQ